jgi:hypothetical protein
MKALPMIGCVSCRSYNDGHFFMSLLRGIGYNFSEVRNA